MIDAIYIFIVIFWLGLILAIIFENRAMAIIAAMGLMVAGVYILAGLNFVNNTVSLALGIVNICVGFYITIQASGVLEI
jgi:hypothetical protein